MEFRELPAVLYNTEGEKHIGYVVSDECQFYFIVLSEMKNKPSLFFAHDVARDDCVIEWLEKNFREVEVLKIFKNFEKGLSISVDYIV